MVIISLVSVIREFLKKHSKSQNSYFADFHTPSLKFETHHMARNTPFKDIMVIISLISVIKEFLKKRREKHSTSQNRHFRNKNFECSYFADFHTLSSVTTNK